MQNSNDIDKLIAESQSRFGKKFLYSFSLIIILIIVFISWIYFFNSEDNSEFVTYQEHKMQKGSIANTIIASGSTQIDQKISLSFGTNGNLSKILVEEGDSVKEGQLLAELDSKDLENTLERQEIQLKKLLEYPSEEDLKGAQYIVNQAEKSLNDLLEYPSIEQLRTAEELVSQAEANFISAQENYDELMVPTDSQFDAVTKLIEQAEQTLSNSNLLLENARKSVDTSKITLTESVNNYCDVDSLPNRKDVCIEIFNYPISKTITDTILDEIFTCCNANTTEMNLSKALINSNSNYSSSIEQVDVYLKQVESSEANLKDANNNLENLRNPSSNDIERLKKLEEQAEKNLQKRLLSLQEMKKGSDIEEIKLAEENLEKSQLALNRVKGGTDSNDIEIQQLLVDQAKENLSKTKIKALFDGQISSIKFKQGEFIASGQSMFTLSDPSTMQMDIIASETEFIEMNSGMYGLVSLDSKPFPPSIIQITSISNVPNVTQGIVTYPVEARFIRGFEVLSVISQFTPLLDSFSGIDLSNIPGLPNIEGFSQNFTPSSANMPQRLGRGQMDNSSINREALQEVLSTLLSEDLPAEGMNGTVTLLKDSVQDVLVVPSEALISDTSGSKVISSILDDKLEYIFVETGLSDGENTEIVSGLEENQLIYIKRVGNNASDTLEEIKTIDELTQGPPGGGPPGGGRPRGRP
ncbi:MAG: biotin/lipoyl-binding protein [Chloroflexota bacterium]|nr:biotin/lipoyl-binding protein [Chloroflexota bacterium]